MQANSGRATAMPAVNGGPLLEVRGLTKHYDITGGLVSRLLNGPRVVKAVDDISFELPRRETLALVGESGSGKSTAARVLCRLVPATAGQVLFQGQDILQAPSKAMKAIRKEVQIVFQDPYSSLSPRMRVGEIVGRPLAIHSGLKGAAARDRVATLLEQVGLSANQMGRYPHEFSGGQRQRIAIARALASEPSLLIADEAVSSLDVSVQAQVLELLQRLRDRLQLTMIFITHDLNVAEFLADRVAVMYGGKLVEEGPAGQVFETPRHPYTQALLASRPRFGQSGSGLELMGEPAAPVNPPPGCRFAHRCPLRRPDCTGQDIPLVERAPGHRVACVLA